MPNLNFLIEKCQKLGRLPAAIVDPRSEVALSGALQAYTQGILEPILVGPQAEIEQIAKDNQLDISALKIVNTPDDVSAAAAAALAAAEEMATAATTTTATATTTIAPMMMAFLCFLTKDLV